MLQVKCGARRNIAERVGRKAEATDARWEEEISAWIAVVIASIHSIVGRIRLGCPFPIITFKVVDIL